jgi:hypothetical protein
MMDENSIADVAKMFYQWLDDNETLIKRLWSRYGQVVVSMCNNAENKPMITRSFASFMLGYWKGQETAKLDGLMEDNALPKQGA